MRSAARHSTTRRTTRHRPHPRHAGRQDRAEPADERDAGGDGAGALQVVVRGLRPRPRQGRRPRPRPAPAHRRPLPRPLRGLRAGRDSGGVEGAIHLRHRRRSLWCTLRLISVNPRHWDALVRIRTLPTRTRAVWTPEVHPKGYWSDRATSSLVWTGSSVPTSGAVTRCLAQSASVYLRSEAGPSAAFVRNSIIEPLAHVEATEIGDNRHSFGQR